MARVLLLKGYKLTDWPQLLFTVLLHFFFMMPKGGRLEGKGYCDGGKRSERERLKATRQEETVHGVRGKFRGLSSSKRGKLLEMGFDDMTIRLRTRLPVASLSSKSQPCTADKAKCAD
ncbi:hypothetical protein HAX54_004148 [Datura stramonium]|uniref:Uncharacterized protein n=1 Tax=Datura stramonium TaxID=4076 RepID=A0ABS8WV31_DATST|nr:hypothetical protein [Datura stramonium]